MCAASKSQFKKHPVTFISKDDIVQAHKDLSLGNMAGTQEIKALSDVYIREEGSAAIWENPGWPSAYLQYFLPLNAMRLERIGAEGVRSGFFEGLSGVVEFGSGPGTAQLALQSMLPNLSWNCIESSEQAKKIHTYLAKRRGLPAPNFLREESVNPAGKLGLFSYSLCENNNHPWLFDCDALFIAEPSTATAGRKLMQLRQELIDKGFYIWGPCTHQLACPQLTKSKTDWCHMRTHWEKPLWIEEIEKTLPMKNDSLTYSYLLAKKTAPQIVNETRIVGDTLFEKGKTRQGICRNAEREYLSWLKRDGKPQIIPRGARIILEDQFEVKGNELRIRAGEQLSVLE